MRNKLTIGAFLLMLTAFIVVLALPADEESIKSENRVMAVSYTHLTLPTKLEV